MKKRDSVFLRLAPYVADLYSALVLVLSGGLLYCNAYFDIAYCTQLYLTGRKVPRKRWFRAWISFEPGPVIQKRSCELWWVYYDIWFGNVLVIIDSLVALFTFGEVTPKLCYRWMYSTTVIMMRRRARARR